ncbi:NADH:flavin oxidoreductase/NADH oxidase [Marinilactibacillus piezotolerans]|uniref:NADH:flavin oxidoreductase/NADH oxidase n=1 Tax=Marinilactibacillus piezotolerans TaxID=258723 RepID=UPI0009B1A06C|nr:NADH:flavin oxidoreductase/NADH oxidase [Marinilactibacillus piezotolerans]
MAKLFEPLQLGKLNLKNRIVMAPMCMYAVHKEDGVLTPFHEAHYASRAIGGASLIILEASAVSPEGRITDQDLGIYSDQQTDKLKTLVRVLHELGSKAGIQLAHAGRKAEDAEDLVAPSALAYSAQYHTPNALTAEGIEKIIQDFKNSAARAQEAGFDVIQVHAAHGYLINQFISPLTNQRTDEYGPQTLENRFRLLKEVLLAVKSVFQGSVWVRFSASDYDENSTTLEEFDQMNQWLETLSVDAVDVSTGGLLPKRPDSIYPGYQTQYAKRFKERSNLFISTVGKLGDPSLANYILEDGQADLISLGRPLLRNPNWPAFAAKALHDKNYVPYNHSYGRGFNE